MKESRWRKDFPILEKKIYNQPLVYLDNAATTQLPMQVIRRVSEHYAGEHANVHRGNHYLSDLSTSAVEDARREIAAFIGSSDPSQVIFTHGTTDGIHLVSAGTAPRLNPGDAVMVTELEHHSNYVPWQQACLSAGADFLVCPAPDGCLDLDRMDTMLRTRRVRLLAVTQVSNLTGTVTPLETIIPLAHRYGAQVLVDGAQGILHLGFQAEQSGSDYYVFSGHKMLSPTGVGVLYGKRECLESLCPVRTGGGMVDQVTPSHTTWGELPHRLEAGTPDISGIVGLGSAVRYLKENDVQEMRKHEEEMMAYLLKSLSGVPGVRILGNPPQRAGAVSFVVDGVHPFDAAAMLDKRGIAVRSGHHCAQPALRSFGEESAVRVSIAFYNTAEEIDRLCETLEIIIKRFRML